MAIPILKLKHEGANIYSPLSGKPAFGKNGANTRDPDLLLVFVGDANEWAYVSKEVRASIRAAGKNLADLTPTALCRRLSVPGAICLKADTGWNGVNWVAWKVPEKR